MASVLAWWVFQQRAMSLTLAILKLCSPVVAALTHFGILQLPLNQCGVVAPPCIHVNLYPKGFMCSDFLSDRNSMWSCESCDWPGYQDWSKRFYWKLWKCMWCGRFSLGTSNHLVLPNCARRWHCWYIDATSLFPVLGWKL